MALWKVATAKYYEDLRELCSFGAPWAINGARTKDADTLPGLT